LKRKANPERELTSSDGLVPFVVTQGVPPDPIVMLLPKHRLQNLHLARELSTYCDSLSYISCLSPFGNRKLQRILCLVSAFIIIAYKFCVCSHPSPVDPPLLRFIISLGYRHCSCCALSDLLTFCTFGIDLVILVKLPCPELVT
jgi:hypothetical protein